jgi:hypothetical protein
MRLDRPYDELVELDEVLMDQVRMAQTTATRSYFQPVSIEIGVAL